MNEIQLQSSAPLVQEALTNYLAPHGPGCCWCFSGRTSRGRERDHHQSLHQVLYQTLLRFTWHDHDPN